MQIINQADTLLTCEFVSPKYCQELHLAGLSANVPYIFIKWHNKDDFNINTFAYDPDKYYSTAFGNILHTPAILKPKVLPAYRLREVELCIPDHLLEKRSGLYRIMVDQVYGNIEQTGIRLPDVYALALLQGIRNRSINLDHINRTHFP